MAPTMSAFARSHKGTGGLLPDLFGSMKEVPEEAITEDQPFLRAHSKLYQRRREIEAELRRELNLVDTDDEFSQAVAVAAARSGPLSFGRPPPVPKPKATRQKLPPIPRPAPEAPKRRWGSVETDSTRASSEEPPSPRHSEKQTTSNQFEETAKEKPQVDVKEDGSKSPPKVRLLPAPPLGSRQPPPVPQVPVNLPPEPASPTQSSRQVGACSSEAPYSSRGGEEQQHAPHDEERLIERPSSWRNRLQLDREREPAHKAMAKELEALAREHRRLTEERRMKQEQANEQARLEAEAGQEEERERREHERREEWIREKQRQEKYHLDEIRREELFRMQQESEEAQRRRQEQEEWERLMRQHFEEEQQQRKINQQLEWEEEIRRQEKLRADIERQREQHQQQQEELDRRRHERRRTARRLQQEEARRRPPSDESVGQSQPQPQPPPPPPGFSSTSSGDHGGGSASRAASPQPPKAPGGIYAPASGTYAPSPPSRQRPRVHAAGVRSMRPPAPQQQQPRTTTSLPRIPTVAASSSLQGSISSEAAAALQLKQAQEHAQRQLRSLRQMPSLDARQKGFKDLLRAWHPDKNPQNVEVATAVFQLIQAERSRVVDS